MPRNFFDVLAHIRQIKRRIVIGSRSLLDLAAHEGERQTGEGQVLRDAFSGRHGLRLTQLVRFIQRRSPVGRGVGNHRHYRVLAFAAGRGLIWMQHPLRLAALPADHGNRIGRRWTDDRVHEVVEEREAVRITPEKRRRVAVHMSHHQLTKLLAFERRRLGRLAIGQRHALFGQRILRVPRHTVRIQSNLARDGHVRVIHRGYVRRIKRHGLALCIDDCCWNTEWRNRPQSSVGVHNWLLEASDIVSIVRTGWSCIEPVRPGITSKIKIKRAVLLEEHKDVLDLVADQPLLFSLRNLRLFRQVDNMRAHRRARLWRDGHIRQWSLLLRRADSNRAKRDQRRNDSLAFHLPHVNKLFFPALL